MLEKYEGEKRKQLIILGSVVAISVVGLFAISTLMSGGTTQQKKEVPKVKIVKEETEELPFKKVYGDRLTQLEAEIEELKKEIKMTNELLKGYQSGQETIDFTGQYTGQYEEKQPPSGPTPSGPKIVSPQESTPIVPPPPPPQQNTQQYNPQYGQQQQQKTVSVQVLDNLIALEGTPIKEEPVQNVKAEEKKKEKKKSIKDTIPAGSFVKAVLLSGLDAPTTGSAQRNPHPVLLKLTDKAILPNKWKTNIKDCFIVGTGYGDLSSERAYIRLERLSCVKNNGDIISKTVEGYVSGEDGKNGLKGRVVSKQGALLARSLVAGFLQGVSQAFSYQQRTLLISPQGAIQTVDPNNAFQYAGISGVSEAAKKLADFYMNLVNKTFPVIEILPGRKVDVVFLKDVKLEEE